MKKSDPPIIVEGNFIASVNVVWSAITEHSKMVKWFFDNIPDFKAIVGFETRFNVVSEERNFLHIWKVTEVIPNKKLVYNWTYEDYVGSADISFELFPKGPSTKLQVKVIVLENFNDDIPEFKRESCISGWEYFIQGQLKEFLN